MYMTNKLFFNNIMTVLSFIHRETFLKKRIIVYEFYTWTIYQNKQKTSSLCILFLLLYTPILYYYYKKKKEKIVFVKLFVDFFLLYSVLHLFLFMSSIFVTHTHIYTYIYNLEL